MVMHIPVLQKEVLQYLNPEPNENFIDCTIGEAGHTLAILERNGPKGKVLGIELDSELYRKLKEKLPRWNLGKRVILVNDSYCNLQDVVAREKFRNVSGILFDLGLSSWHLEESKRGFSFLRQEPLDMRYTQESRLSAEKIINYWSIGEIEKILREYGEERFARQIAKNIISFRQVKPIRTTSQLVDIVKRAIPFLYQQKKIHPATRTFQALRIAVNNELDNLEKALPQAMDILKQGGRLAVISFHSLEDRIVKNFFKKYTGSTRASLKILTKKPISPRKEEIEKNPRSRSAKLRVAEKLRNTKNCEYTKTFL